MTERRWGYGPTGERRLLDEGEAMPKGWAASPDVFWTDEERAAPEWPAWYLAGTGRPVEVTGVAEVAEAETPAPKKRGRPRKAAQ
jgi:hypothetical protein